MSLEKEGAEGVVAALLRAHGAAAAAEDRNGNLPIHLALQHEASSQVAHALLAAYPEAVTHTNAEGSLPLHVAIANEVGLVHIYAYYITVVYTLVLHSTPVEAPVRPIILNLFFPSADETNANVSLPRGSR